MKRGTICWVNLEPASPPEFGKVRPALVVSNSSQNVLLPSLVVLPISSKPPEIWPLRVAVKMPNGKESFVVLPGIRQVNKARLEQTWGQISLASAKKIDEALELYLS